MSTAWALVMQIGFWGWISAAALLAFRGFPAVGVFDARRARVPALAFVAFFALWITGMVNA